jgi:3-deoxy-D-manno-octulosonate 8-phosphate phosphatase KdsC-like HAD superfamily phosphatase
LSSDGFEVAKPMQAAVPAQQKFTISAGDTVAIMTGDDEDSSWHVLLVPSHGQTKTIYYGDNNKAMIIYDLANEVQIKANDTGKAQIFTLPSDTNQSINQ